MATTLDSADVLISSSQAAGMLGVTTQTLYLWRRKGKIQTQRQGTSGNSPLLVPLSEVERIKRENEAAQST